MTSSISFSELQVGIRSRQAPLVIDVRRAPAFMAATDMIAGAVRRDPERIASWAAELPSASKVVVYCAHGHEVSQGVAKALNERGIAAQYLEGGIDEGWKAAGGALDHKPAGAHTRWVTRERPKVDRIACPWLIKRFVDPDAEFLYVPAQEVMDIATQDDAIPFDVPNVELGHHGPACTFDAIIGKFNLNDPALHRLAVIVRGADTDDKSLAPECRGLEVIAEGFRLVHLNDHELLEKESPVYDALYAYCQEAVRRGQR